MTRVRAGLICLIGGSAAAALTISPTSHDYGKVAVMGLANQTFTTTLPSGVTRGTLTYAITGPDAADFLGSGTDQFAPNSGCPSGPQGVACEHSVEFRPRSMGLKRATLEVTDNSGNRATAALKGEAVAALCNNRVIFCNYAHHYSGVVSWNGGDGYANVDVVMGVASCNAAISGGSGMTSGPGLIGVEFGLDTDEINGPFYRITVACPIRFASEPGYPPVPVRPAELGHDEFGSYKQPLGMTIAEANARPPKLKGSYSEGGEVVSWDLCPNSQYQFPVRQAGSLRQGRCAP